MSTRDTAPNIATRAEVDHLEMQRSRPEFQYGLTPDGIEMAHIEYNLQRWRERRIHYLERRLGLASHVFNRDLGKSFAQEM